MKNVTLKSPFGTYELEHDVDYKHCDGGFDCLMQTIEWAYEISREELLCTSGGIFDSLPFVAADPSCLVEFFFADRYNFLEHEEVETVLNIGAADGLTSVLMGRFANTVISIEPIEYFHSALLENSKNMKEVWGVESPVLLCGLGKESGKALITMHEDENPSDPPIQTNADIIAGDSLDLVVDVIKIDAYLMEHDVLQGLEETISLQHPELYIALYDANTVDEILNQDWFDFLQDHDYLITEFTREYIRAI